jgi:rubredoxin
VYQHLTNSQYWPKNVARRADGRLDLWVCDECQYVYDPEEGDKWLELPPGVPFETLPEDWECPECGASKDRFFR